MNKQNLNNYINLCKTCDLITIKNIYDGLISNSYESMNDIPYEYINSMKILNNNGVDYSSFVDIYNNYHNMIGGKGGKIQGTKGMKHLNIKKQLKKQLNKQIKKHTGIKNNAMTSLTNTIPEIAILNSRMEELNKNMLMEISKNNYVLSTLTKDMAEMNKKIDTILPQIKKE